MTIVQIPLRRSEPAAATGVSAMFIASLYFLCLQAFVLHAFCPFCLFCAAVTFLLTGLLLVAPTDG